MVGVGLSSFVVLDFLTLQSPQRCDVKFVFEDLLLCFSQNAACSSHSSFSTFPLIMLSMSPSKHHLFITILTNVSLLMVSKSFIHSLNSVTLLHMFTLAGLPGFARDSCIL